MKNIIYLFAFLFAVSSCKKEGCIDINATNYDSEAKKDDGSCIYPDPYDARDIYEGSFSVLDSTFLGGPFYEEKNYALVVSKDANNVNQLTLDNLFNGTNSYYVSIDTNDGSFSVPSQQVSGPFYITGSGSISGDLISMETSGDVYVNKISGSK